MLLQNLGCENTFGVSPKLVFLFRTVAGGVMFMEHALILREINGIADIKYSIFMDAEFLRLLIR